MKIKKSVDKLKKMCYNIGTVRERAKGSLH